MHPTADVGESNKLMLPPTSPQFCSFSLSPLPLSLSPETVVNCTVRGAFEYSGQKCSATSRMYIPESLWPEVERERS